MSLTSVYTILLEVLPSLSMSDFCAIRVLNFTGKKEEWLTRSEKFLARARISSVMDILLGKLTIPKTNEEISKKTDADL